MPTGKWTRTASARHPSECCNGCVWAEGVWGQGEVGRALHNREKNPDDRNSFTSTCKYSPNLLGSRDEPYDILEGEPANKHSLCYLKKIFLLWKEILLLILWYFGWNGENCQQLLLTVYAVIILLLELGQGGEDEAEGGDDHEHAGHHRHHLEQGEGGGCNDTSWQRSLTLAAQESWGFSNRFQRRLCTPEQ